MARSPAYVPLLERRVCSICRDPLHPPGSWVSLAQHSLRPHLQTHSGLRRTPPAGGGRAAFIASPHPSHTQERREEVGKILQGLGKVPRGGGEGAPRGSPAGALTGPAPGAAPFSLQARGMIRLLVGEGVLGAGGGRGLGTRAHPRNRLWLKTRHACPGREPAGPLAWPRDCASPRSGWGTCPCSATLHAHELGPGPAPCSAPAPRPALRHPRRVPGMGSRTGGPLSRPPLSHRPRGTPTSAPGSQRVSRRLVPVLGQVGRAGAALSPGASGGGTDRTRPRARAPLGGAAVELSRRRSRVFRDPAPHPGARRSPRKQGVWGWFPRPGRGSPRAARHREGRASGSRERGPPPGLQEGPRGPPCTST